LHAWVVTRYEDVDAVLRDPVTFSSVNSLRPLRDLHPATVAELAAGYPQAPDHVTSDGAMHRRLRTPYAPGLTAGTVRLRRRPAPLRRRRTAPRRSPHRPAGPHRAPPASPPRSRSAAAAPNLDKPPRPTVIGAGLVNYPNERCGVWRR